MSAPVRTQFLACGAAVGVGVTHFWLRARLPEDYDSVGFVLALRDFSLERFQPQFPGYPVYVAFGRLVGAFGAGPLNSAIMVSSLATAGTFLGVWFGLAQVASTRMARASALLYAVASLPLSLGGTALSDATGLAFVVLAFVALALSRCFLGGVLIALALGVRLSYWPLVASWLTVAWVWRRPMFLRASVGFGIGTCVWLVPLIVIVGGHRLLALGFVHERGHFQAWGGTIAAQADYGLRARTFVRDVVYDGIAPNVFSLLTLGLCAVMAGRPERLPQAFWLTFAIIIVPYGLWAFLGQNVVEQPRHALPLVLALLVFLGWRLSSRVPLAAMGIAAVAVASFALARARAQTLPAAAQAAAYVAQHFPPQDTVVFGQRSVRLFRTLAPTITACERGWLSEVDVDLERLNHYPQHILVTSEVESDRTRDHALKPGPTFCRDARLDRQSSCLQLFEYAPRQGSAP